MRFFLRTRKFRICAAVISLVLIGSIVMWIVGGIFSPGSGIMGVIISPFQQLITGVGNAVSDFGKKLNDGNALLLENKQLEEELNKLRNETAQMQEITQQNEFYRDYLEIKEKNPDFKFCDAKLISMDTDDPFKCFTINRGSSDGISLYDPVISGNYLLGYVSSLGLTTCKVTTILSPEIVMGANDSRTSDTGLITGTADFAAEGKVRFYNLARSCNVAVGDFVITSGEGVFPEGLLIGTVDNIKSENYTSSIYATVIPFADFSDIRNVMVITDFAGQGTLGQAVE